MTQEMTYIEQAAHATKCPFSIQFDGKDYRIAISGWPCPRKFSAKDAREFYVELRSAWIELNPNAKG